MTDDNVALLANGDDLSHRFEHDGMLVLARKSEFLRQVTLADQHGADSRNVGQDLVEVRYAGRALDHKYDDDLTVGRERPDVGTRVVFRLRKTPVAGSICRPIAAHAA